MAQFSDTTNKNGLIQLWEFWTRTPDGQCTGTLLKQTTARINAAFENILPLLLSFNDQIRWDDLNHTDAPVGFVNIVSGQNDYKVTTDTNSYDILNITKVRVHISATDTVYHDLERISADDPRVPEILNPSYGVTSPASGFLELGNTLYLDVKPNYACTSGIEITFGRQQQYFVSTDTTKKPGIPLPFHELLALYAALDWNLVNRTEDGNLISQLTQRIAQKRKDLEMLIDLRHPTRAIMTPKKINYM